MKPLVRLCVLTLTYLSMMSVLHATTMDKLVEKAERRYIKTLSRGRDPSDRAEAARSLGRHATPNAIQALTEALADKDPVVRQAVCGALWDLGKDAASAMPALRRALHDASPAVQARAAGALETMGVDPAELVDARTQVLRTGETSDRFLAARGLIGFTPAPVLAPHMVDYAFEACGANGTTAQSFLDLTSAQRNNLEMAEEALARLTRKGDRDVLPLLTGRVASYHYANGAVLKAAGTFEPPPEGWMELLLRQLAFNRSGLTQVVVDLMLKRQKEEEVTLWAPAVAVLARSSDDGERLSAVVALGMGYGFASAQADVLARAVISDRDPKVRRSAASSLGLIGDRKQPITAARKQAVVEAAGSILREVMCSESEDTDLRRAALKSWIGFQLPADELVAGLSAVAQKTQVKEMKVEALQALRNLGSQAKAAEPVVQTLAKDPDALVRRMAEAALQVFAKDLAGSAILGPSGPAADPERERAGLAVLQERKAQFTEQGFYLALSEADKDLITAYLDAGMSPNHRFKTFCESTPLYVLMFSAKACDAAIRPTPRNTTDILRILLTRGADPNLADTRGNVPLMPMVQKCEAQVVRMFLDAGARYDLANLQGMTPLEFGLWNAADGAQALIKAGARLSPDQVATYRKAYKDNPKVLELIRAASED